MGNNRIILLILFVLFGILGGTYTFAQSLPGGLYNGVTVNNQWFANQERKTTAYTQAQCSADGGVWKNRRLYLKSDQNSNGLKDYTPDGNTFHLKDNMLYSGDPSNTYRLALILSKGTNVEGGQSVGSTVYYYTPSGYTNMFSVFANGTAYPIDTNRAWYRYSKVAPLNQPVRAVTSEAVLFEQPSGELNPLERMVQVAYQLRYTTYRSVNNNATSDYQVFPVANMDDFSALGPINSWYVKNPIVHNNGLGPVWNSDYLKTSTITPTQAINRGPERTHALECANYYLSRCGDGYIDVTGQQPTNGSGQQPHTISDAGVNEQCDPGTNLNSWTDDIMPGGVPATATYNCSATCTLIGTPATSPNLTIDKQQKLLTGTVFSGVGLGTPSDIGYTSPSKFEFKIIITNNGGDATNVIMRDTLPEGFVVDALPNGCYGTVGSTTIACNAPAGGQISSQAFNLSGGQTATFTIIGTLTNDKPTVNKASATYTDPTTGTTKETPIDVVNQHPNVFIPPQIIYTKTVRNVTTNSNGGSFVEADNLSGGVLVNTGDVVEYEITIQKLTGTVVNTILSDVLPTNNGFIMSGYSINGAPMIVATSFPATNITALLNSGNVVVKLYGSVGQPTATQFVNTAFLTENSVPAGTLAPGSNVAWTYLPTVKPNPKLHLQKYWINPNNPNLTGDHYTVPVNTPIKFILRVTNIGNVAAAGVVYDTCPTNLTCQSYRILPSTVSVSYSSTIPVGTIPVGGYVEVEVTAIAYPTASNAQIKNIAKLYRVCTLEEDIADGVKDGLCHENDDDATLDPQGNNQCGDGVKQSDEQCDLKSMPTTIGNYLDLTTNYPSVTSTFNHRGKTCNTKCEIVDPGLNICGDGKLGKLEQCDLGAGMPKTIGNYLDNTSTYPSGVYNGKTCSANCVIEGDNQPEMPACWYGDTIISIMDKEYFPFSWDIELPEGSDIINSCSDASSDGKILRSSLTCDFRIYNRNGEINGPEWLKNIPCFTDTWGSSKLFEQFRVPTDGERDPLFVKNPIGTYYINPTEFKKIVGNELGEYKLSLNRVNYRYCQGGKEVQGNPYARVCQVNFAVTDHYLMQKGSVSTVTNSDLKDYFLLDGRSLYEATDLKKIDLISNLNYANLSTKLNIMTNNLIAKYEKIAVSDKLGSNKVDAKKVPGQSIYILNGNKTLNAGSFPKATTIIVKGDLTVVGNIDKNSLIIAQGTVKFDLPEPSDRRNSCDPQVINGIIIAQKGFVRSSNDGFKNDDLNQPRCRKGNLKVYGALVGNNLEAVVNSRRSHLEHWFTFNQNGAIIAGGSNGDSRVKAERRDEVYNGASVSIEQNPSLWRDVPPGADEFLKTLNISRN